MKEININIEGYNVNGICIGCLNYNRKMFYDSEATECFRILANIDVPDGLTIQVCYECLAAVRSAMRFQEKILQSYDFLMCYSKEHTFLNSPDDFTQYATARLSATDVEIYSLPITHQTEEVEDKVFEEIGIEVKQEDDMKFNISDVKSLKEEPDYDEGNDFPEDLPPLDNDVTSDDDMQLSKLKKKKERKIKKVMKMEKTRKKVKSTTKTKSKYKTSYKLKNLPENIVELYTMTEEEMWSIRSLDVNSKEFVKLKYKCEDCVRGFNSEKLMHDHLNRKHKPKDGISHQCYICKAFFLTKDNLSVHRSLHLSAYRCKQCDLITGVKRIMAGHLCLRGSGGAEERGHRCPNCGGEFGTKSKLTYHKSVCQQEKPQCDCCGKVFANKMTLKYHLKILPLQKDDKPKEKLYIPCKGCSKVFHSKKSYRAHVVIHDGVRYPCPTCGKLFQWKRNLSRHARNHRERAAGARHECGPCGRRFASRDCYLNHMRLSKRHATDDAYAHTCDYCGKKFPTKWCMVDHIDWDHLKRIKYQCTVCFKAFKTAKIMVAHINNIHEGKRREPEAEHLCDICGKSYKTVKRLKGHVWAMHTKRSTTKSFKCKLCPATFTWQTSIYKHMKMMHDNKRIKQPRQQPVKKEEPYQGVELANRMQYFQQNIASNLVQNIVHTVHIQPLETVHNLV